MPELDDAQASVSISNSGRAIAVATQRQTTSRLHIGYHESSNAGYAAMGREAVAAGGDTFAFFTRNPRGGKSKPIDMDDASALLDIMAKNHFAPIVSHAPYTMNPCSAKEDLRIYAQDMLASDLIKLEVIAAGGDFDTRVPQMETHTQPAVCYYNLHPGCHTGQGEAEGIRLAANVISAAIKNAAEKGAVHTAVLIETMAGKGSEIGATFESIHNIIDAIEVQLSPLTTNHYPLTASIGVCMDTCHVWDAGYDVAGDIDGVLTEFDKKVGLQRLKAIHLNDSMNERGSRKDRHQKIGKGFIGLDALYRVTRHAALLALPFILETPNEPEGYKEEIQMLRLVSSDN